MNTLSRVVRAREALEDGDVAFAAEILADLETDLAAELPERLPTLACPDCSARFRRPGELDHHQQFVHQEEAA